jgi:hypothetical protein
MTDVAESVKSLETFVVTEAVTKKRIVFEAEDASTDKTITLDNLTTIQNALLTKKSDGSNVAFTKATNVLTITEEGLSDADLIGFAVGV